MWKPSVTGGSAPVASKPKPKLKPVPLHLFNDEATVFTDTRPPADQCWFWAGKVYHRRPIPVAINNRPLSKRFRRNTTGFTLPVLWSPVSRSLVSPRIFLWLELHGPTETGETPKLVSRNCQFVHLRGNDFNAPFHCINPHHHQLAFKPLPTPIFANSLPIEQIVQAIEEFTSNLFQPNFPALFEYLSINGGIGTYQAIPAIDRLDASLDLPAPWRKAWKTLRPTLTATTTPTGTSTP